MNQLEQANMPNNIKVMDVVDSTMIKGREMCAKGMSRPFAVVANQQTAGYGKFGRRFLSPKGSGLYATFVFDVNISDFSAGLLTTGVAASVAQVIFKLTGIPVDLKWVNDLYYRNRKIAGILVEGVLSEGRIQQVMIGIGINLLTTVVPPELRNKIGALDVDVDKSRLIQEIFTALQDDFEGYQQGRHLPYYQEHAYLRNREVTAQIGKKMIVGRVVGVGLQGQLLLDDALGVRHELFSGEVQKVHF